MKSENLFRVPTKKGGIKRKMTLKIKMKSSDLAKISFIEKNEYILLLNSSILEDEFLWVNLYIENYIKTSNKSTIISSILTKKNYAIHYKVYKSLLNFKITSHKLKTLIKKLGDDNEKR